MRSFGFAAAAAAAAVAVLASGPVASKPAPPDDEAEAEDRIVRIHGMLDGPRARFVVRHELVIERAYPGHQASLELPIGAIATAATVVDGTTRRRLDLVASDRARRTFDDLLVRARGHTERRSIVLVEHGRHDTLEVYAALPLAERLVLDLEIEVPACYHADQRHVLIPPTWADALGPTQRRSPVDAARLVEHCSRDASDHSWIAFPAPPPTQLAVDAAGLALPSPPPPPPTTTATGSTARPGLEAQRLARIELAVAGELSTIPADLATALVVDGSRSMTPEQRAAQDALVAGYLRAAPESRVQLVVYARRARALLPSWTTARDAAAALASLRAISPQNGSNLDEGLAEAGRWLARTTGTRRVVLVGDEQLASRFRTMPHADLARALARDLPARTLVHVARVVPHAEDPERYDSLALAPLAAATGGIGVLSGPGAGGVVDATVLVRPIAIDHVEIAGSGWRAFEPCLDRLVEGTGCTWFGEGDSLLEPLTVEGMLWGTRIARVVRAEPARAKLVARELSTHTSRFTPATRAAIERAAHAVNAQWSLLGTWGGAGGYRDRNRASPRHESHSSSASTMHGISGIGTRRPRPPTTIDLAPQLRAAVLACRPARPVTATIETTLSEIVDVAVALGGAPLVAAEHARVTTCIADAIWATAVVVPDHFHAGTSIARF